MSSDVAWALILGKVDKVKDFGRLMRVNRLFNRLVDVVCWPGQVRALQIGPRWISVKTHLWRDGDCIEPEEDRITLLEKVRVALSLVAKVSENARTLQGLQINLNHFNYNQAELYDLTVQALQILTKSDKPKLASFCLSCYHVQNESVFLALAEFIASKASTLKSLSLNITLASQEPVHLRFLLALQACTQLESVKLRIQNCSCGMGEFASFLAKASGLKALELSIRPLSPAICSPFVQVLSSLCQLTCQFEILEPYLATVQERHPLQELTLVNCHFLLRRKPLFLSRFPYQDFPRLRLLRLNELDVLELREMIGYFLALYRGQPGPEKTLELQVKQLCMNRSLMELWPNLPREGVLVAAIQETVVCICTLPRPPSAQFIFSSGNGAFYVTLVTPKNGSF